MKVVLSAHPKLKPVVKALEQCSKASPHLSREEQRIMATKLYEGLYLGLQELSEESKQNPEVIKASQAIEEAIRSVAPPEWGF